MLRKILNYFKYVKIVRKHKNDKEWSQFNLRLDWLQRLYTVISLSNEEMGEEIVIRQLKVTEHCIPIFDYLSSIGFDMFFDVLIPKISYIDGTNSYNLDFKLNI